MVDPLNRQYIIYGHYNEWNKVGVAVKCSSMSALQLFYWVKNGFGNSNTKTFRAVERYENDGDVRDACLSYYREIRE